MALSKRELKQQMMEQAAIAAPTLKALYKLQNKERAIQTKGKNEYANNNTIELYKFIVYQLDQFTSLKDAKRGNGNYEGEDKVKGSSSKYGHLNCAGNKKKNKLEKVTKQNGEYKEGFQDEINHYVRTKRNEEGHLKQFDQSLNKIVDKREQVSRLYEDNVEGVSFKEAKRILIEKIKSDEFNGINNHSNGNGGTKRFTITHVNGKQVAFQIIKRDGKEKYEIETQIRLSTRERDKQRRVNQYGYGTKEGKLIERMKEIKEDHDYKINTIIRDMIHGDDTMPKVSSSIKSEIKYKLKKMLLKIEEVEVE